MTLNYPSTPTSDREAQLLAALEGVQRPETGESLVDAGLVAGVDVEDDRATVAVDPDALAGEDGEALAAASVRAARTVEGIESAHVEPASGGDSETAAPDDTRTTGVEAFDHVVAVASTKGGVGKSTVAVNLACALATDADVGVFDADVYGPNVPTLLDVDAPVHSTDTGNPIPVDAGGMEVMSVGLMADDAPLAWRGAMAHDALADLFADTAWASDDVLVLDLPPGTGDTVLTTLQEVPVDGVVFVTTPFHTSVADTERSLDLFRENDVPVLGVVRNMRSFECPSCGDEHAMFPGEDTGLDAPVLASLPFDRDLQGSPTPGDPPAAFTELGSEVTDRIESAWEPDVPADAIDLRSVPPDGRRDRVREAVAARTPGDDLVLVSDRDPTPVRSFLADLADVDPEVVAPFEVERATPETWVARTERP